MTLLTVSPSRVLNRFVPAPLPPAGTFKHQTVLVTGATTGLGLAAAIHFVSLGANVIITCRDVSRGEAAKSKIEEAARDGDRKPSVTTAELDMNRYASCVALIDGLKKKLDGRAPDIVVLNAGSITPQYTVSPEGWEQTIQVNALSTTLLGLLFLDWMKQDRASRDSPAHLVLNTSRDHLYPNIKDWPKWAADEGILKHLSSKDKWPAWWLDFEPNYANSKLLVMYAFEEMCKRALGPDGEPLVIVNSVCPGMVNTDIGRSISQLSPVMKVITAVYLAILGKTPDQGARYLVNAAIKPKEEHGQFNIAWLTYEQYLKKANANLRCEKAQNVHALAWKEIITELEDKVPSLKDTK